MNICEDGYSGNNDPVKPIEIIEMNTDRLDNGAVVVNFNLVDIENDEVIKSGGYVCVRQDNYCCKFYVTVFDASGCVCSETVVPFNFEEIE